MHVEVVKKVDTKKLQNSTTQYNCKIWRGWHMVHRNVINEKNIWLAEVGHFPAFKWRKLVGRKISYKLN